MKKTLWILGLALGCALSAGAKPVQTGLEVLQARGFDILQGKRVGLCTNPTGIDRNFRSTADILFEAEGVQLVALYGPEHGIRGDIYAGDKVDNTTDSKTGLPVYSLFGKTRKPTPEMLQDIDIMVYDIQDIGCRSYTFISTMGMLMQACAENHKTLVVLDRPNPLGGNKIEGNLAEDGFISFVSQFKIPYLYGQTCGELALMLNGGGEIIELNGRYGMMGSAAFGFETEQKHCLLQVVKMNGWERSMTFDKTGLPWVAASPHIPNPNSALFYPTTGIMGELYYYNIGVGYTMPFELMALPKVNADSLATALNACHLAGVAFRPIYYKPFYSSHKGENVGGVQIYLTDYEQARLSEIQFVIAQELHRLYPDLDLFQDCDQSRFSMFDKVCGTDQIRTLFAQHYNWHDAENYWRKDADHYRLKAKEYYLYE